jgi:hypothetical protein
MACSYFKSFPSHRLRTNCSPLTFTLQMSCGPNGNRGWSSTPNPSSGTRLLISFQHLHNCEARLHADPVGMVKRMADLAEVDDERVTLWTFARSAADPRPFWDNPMWMEIARALDH